MLDPPVTIEGRNVVFNWLLLAVCLLDRIHMTMILVELIILLILCTSILYCDMRMTTNSFCFYLIANQQANQAGILQEPLIEHVITSSYNLTSKSYIYMRGNGKMFPCILQILVGY